MAILLESCGAALFFRQVNAAVAAAGSTYKGGFGVARLASIDQDRLKALAATFSGVLLRPGDDGYEEARRIHNGLIDKRPALIARCLGIADIVEALGFARDSGLEVSVRGGGHNVAGRAVTDDGVMIDPSPMKGIHVDPKTRTGPPPGTPDPTPPRPPASQ